MVQQIGAENNGCVSGGDVLLYNIFVFPTLGLTLSHTGQVKINPSIPIVHDQLWAILENSIKNAKCKNLIKV
jgi:hypothetical protein